MRRNMHQRRNQTGWLARGLPDKDAVAWTQVVSQDGR